MLLLNFYKKKERRRPAPYQRSFTHILLRLLRNKLIILYNDENRVLTKKERKSATNHKSTYAEFSLKNKKSHPAFGEINLRIPRGFALLDFFQNIWNLTCRGRRPLHSVIFTPIYSFERDLFFFILHLSS